MAERADSRSLFTCSLCQDFASKSYNGVIRHIGQCHAHDPVFTITCGLGRDKCPATYTKFQSFRSHVYKKHRDDLFLPEDTVTNHENTIDDRIDEGQADGNDTEETFDNEKLSRSAALFIVKTMEVHKVSQTAVNGIVEANQVVFDCAVSRIRTDLVKQLHVLGVTNDQLTTIEPIFSAVVNPYQGLDTAFKQDKFIKNNLPYVEPVERVLRRYYTQNKKGECTERLDCCYDIPLLDSLQQLLNCHVVYKQIVDGHASFDGNLRDYCDGSNYLSHSLFTTDPIALQIQLYYDDLEICNPLGSKATIHKLGIFYYSLGNLHPRLRSVLQSIQLVTVVKTNFITDYGIDVILEPFISHLKQLEQDTGVSFLIKNEVTYVRGTLVNVSADNPAACLLGGFKQLHSAFRKCRSCMAVGTNMQTEFRESSFQLRSRELHSKHIEDLGGTLGSHNAITNGVYRNSILNQSRFFHVVDGIGPDIMHDILEGVIQLTVTLLLRALIIDKRRFQLRQINSRIYSFCYGPVDATNKPSPLKEKNFLPSSFSVIKQSASQSWCLLRFLPFLIEDLLEEDDNDLWDNFLSLSTIVDEVFAPVTNKEKIAYLRVLIEDFLVDFCKLYGNDSITPKTHYLIHVPSWMRRFGPLTRFWCMRYEAKHSYFKQMSHVVNNFKNIPKSLARHHQRLMCYHMSNPASYLTSKCTYGKVTATSVGSLEYRGVLSNVGLSDVDSIHRVKFAAIHGTKYSIGYIVLCYYEDEMPVFGKIKDIVILSSGECLFVIIPVVSSCYNARLHSFQVSVLNDVFLLYKQNDFLDYHPLTISQSFKTSSYMFKFLNFLLSLNVVVLDKTHIHYWQYS